MVEKVEPRREMFQRYTSLPSYPTFVCGHFDPEAWAEGLAERDADGVVPGPARVILDLDEADALQPGEVLVTPVTNVGWTPVFLQAAVVGCTDATVRVRTGDQLQVDGQVAPSSGHDPRVPRPGEVAGDGSRGGG